jgi:hypothetical protein
MLSLLVDLAIAICLCGATIRMGYMGVHVTLHPVEDPKEKRKHKRQFWIWGAVAVCLIGAQTIRNGMTQSDLRVQLAKIQRNTEQPPKVEVTNNVPPTQVVLTVPNATVQRGQAQVFVASVMGVKGFAPFGGLTQFSLQAIIKNNGSHLATDCHSEARLIYGSLGGKAEDALFANFRKSLNNSTEASRDLGVGQDYTVPTNILDLNVDEYNAVTNPNSANGIVGAVYMVSIVRYKDSGVAHLSEGCMYFTGTSQSLEVPHYCEHHNTIK